MALFYRSQPVKAPIEVRQRVFVRQFNAFPNKNEHFTKFNPYMQSCPVNFNWQTSKYQNNLLFKSPIKIAPWILYIFLRYC